MHVDEIHVELLREHRLHFLGLTLTQQPMVHEHANHLPPDGLRAERRHHTGIHATGEPQDHAVLPHLVLNSIHALLDDGVHGPRTLKPAHPEQEVLQHLLTIGRMANLRMELRGIQPSLSALHRCHRAHIRARRNHEPFRHLAHRIPMAHPNRLPRRSALEQC